MDTTSPSNTRTRFLAAASLIAVPLLPLVLSLAGIRIAVPEGGVVRMVLLLTLLCGVIITLGLSLLHFKLFDDASAVVPGIGAFIMGAAEAARFVSAETWTASGFGEGVRVLVDIGMAFLYFAAGVFIFPRFYRTRPGIIVFSMSLWAFTAAGSRLCAVYFPTSGIPYLFSTLMYVILPAAFAMDLIQSYFREKRSMVAALTGDLTEMEVLKEALRQARDEAEQANKSKSIFLANMSHEIRTPINPIIVLTELMLKDPAIKDKRYIEIIHTAGKTLLDIVNDILDLAKIESGKFEIIEEDFILEPFLKSIVGIFEGQTVEKGITLSLHIDTGVSRIVRGDRKRLGQVLRNLIGNAVKFTDKGEIRVAITAPGQRHGNYQLITFSVKDTGIGIPQGRLQKIFERFEQSDGSITRRYGGTGLGLSISTQLLNLMDAELMVESKEGKGSTFYFTLNMECPDAQNFTEPEDEEEAALESGLHILAADDQPFNQKVIEAIFVRMGHKATFAKNGQEAIDAFKAGYFDAILMDIQMPVVDGISATQRIREIEKIRGVKNPVPIMALTANVMKEDIERYLLSGFDGCAGKPIETGALLEQLCEWSERIRRRRAEFQITPSQQPAPGPDAATQAATSSPVQITADEGMYFDPGDLRALGADAATLSELIDALIAGLRDNVAALEGALERNDIQGSRKACHNLLGTAGSMAVKMHALIASVQDLLKVDKIGEARACYYRGHEIIEKTRQQMLAYRKSLAT
ncbi:MAG: response regulator [Nitrospirae bacterium]|nr:response regulator [Nitrospirota bacterium]